MILAASGGQILFLIVGIACLVTLATWLLKRRRRGVWRKLARERGLRFHERNGRPHLTGQIQGRQVEIATDDSSSDVDEGGVAVVQLRVGLQNAPPQMIAEGIPGPVGNVATLMEDQERMIFPDEDFDRQVIVKGRPEEGIRAYWTPVRQQEFLRLVQHAPCDQVSIMERQIIAEERDIISDPSQLNTLLDLLLAAASHLDAATNRMEG